MKNTLKAYALSFVFLGLTLGILGCTLSASITELEPLPSETPSIFGKSAFMGNVSGSLGYDTTPVNRYLVRQSAGLILNQQYITTAQGYKVYINVSGQISADETGD